MGIFDGCLLASDIDGTLVAEEGTVNPKVVEKVKYFVSEGGAFSIATGRSVGAIGTVLNAIDCLSPSVVANGAMIFDYSNNRIFYQNLLTDEDKKFARAILDMNVDVGIEIHSGQKAYLLRRNQESDDHERYESFDAEEIDYESSLKLDWNKIIYMFTDPEDIPKAKELIAKTGCTSDFMDTIAYIYDRKRFYLEQIPHGVSKASAISKLCELLNIKDGCYYAIGDYYNDIPMLKTADVCAVPIDSPEDIKNMADVIVSTAKNGAVADFIDYLTERTIKNER